MYPKINTFLLSHQYLDLKKVPGFYQFFYSFDFEVMQVPWGFLYIHIYFDLKYLLFITSIAIVFRGPAKDQLPIVQGAV